MVGFVSGLTLAPSRQVARKRCRRQKWRCRLQHHEFHEVNFEEKRTVDSGGVEWINRADVDDLWTGSDLVSWHSHERRRRLVEWFQRAFLILAPEEEEETTQVRDQKEDLDRELKLISAATGIKIVDDNGDPTLQGFVLLFVTLLPVILVSLALSGYLAHVLVHLSNVPEF